MRKYMKQYIDSRNKYIGICKRTHERTPIVQLCNRARQLNRKLHTNRTYRLNSERISYRT